MSVGAVCDKDQPQVLEPASMVWEPSTAFEDQRPTFAADNLMFAFAAYFS